MNVLRDSGRQGYIHELFRALLISFRMLREMSVLSDVPWIIMLVWRVKLLSELSSYMVFMSYSTVMCTGNHLGHSCVVQWLSNLISEYVEGRG
jgi:hypothetical protein